MTTIKLTFVNRVKLTGILSGARGGDGGFDKLHALLKVFDYVRFTESEQAELTLTDLGGGTVNYQISDPAASGKDFGCKEVLLEDAQAKWLLKEMDAWGANATLADLAWFDPLKEQLTAGTPQPIHQFKRKSKC